MEGNLGRPRPGQSMRNFNALIDNFLSIWADWHFPLLCFIAAAATKHLRRDETIL
jgi:hypothetical protein